MQDSVISRLRAMLLSLLLAAIPAAAAAGDDPPADFEAFWSLYDAHYALFGVKHVDWDAVYRIYRPKVAADTSRGELFAIFEQATSLLNDVHVTVTDRRSGRQSRSGGRSIGTGAFDVGIFSLDLVASAYAQDGLATRAGGILNFGWLEDDVGYVHLSAFKYPTSSEQAIDEIVETFENARAVVVDVRQNGGGSDRVGQLVANRFATEQRLYMTVAGRVAGRGRLAFSDPEAWHVAPEGPKQFTGPVIVLTNSRTISAAENFVLAMRVIPRTLILGETTAGAMADAYNIDIANDWAFGVPVNVFRDAQGVCWEGIGLVPDIWIANAPVDIASGSDRVLEMALSLAGQNLAPRSRVRVSK